MVNYRDLKEDSFLCGLFLWEYIGSSGPPCGFNQRSGKYGVGKRRNGDGASELYGRSPCGVSNVPSSWHGTAWTGLLPEQRGFAVQVLITSLCHQSEEQNWWFPVWRCLLRIVANTQEKRWILHAVWRLTVRHLSLLFDPTPIKHLVEYTYFSKALENMVTKGVWVLLQAGQERCGRRGYSEICACTVK